MEDAPTYDGELVPEAQPAKSAMDLVSAGATIMRIENETMMSVAIQRPRDERTVLKKALEELEIVPALAQRCFYSIPYKERRGGEERTVYVTGASVHTARNLMRRWGNCAAKTMITSEDDDKVVLAGVFLDLESNARTERVFTVSKWQHRRKGPPVRVNAERLVQAVQAGASKAERNAIVAGLPDWLTQSYYDKARAIAAKEARSEGAISKITQAFLAEGVTRDMLEKHLAKRLDKLSPDDLANLRGLLSALLEHETTVEEVFGGGDGGNGKEPAAEAPPAADVDTVLAGGAKVTGGTEAKAPAPAHAGGDHEPAWKTDTAGITACERCGELKPEEPKQGRLV